MSALEDGFRDYWIDEPCEFPAPPPELMAELRRLLPPVAPVEPVDAILRRSA